MATITIHPEHVDGLRYLYQRHFEMACEAEDAGQLRVLLGIEESLPINPIVGSWSGEVSMPDDLLAAFLEHAWEAGNELMSDVHSQRAKPDRKFLADPERDEREGRSMLAFHGHMQGQKVAS